MSHIRNEWHRTDVCGTVKKGISSTSIRFVQMNQRLAGERSVWKFSPSVPCFSVTSKNSHRRSEKYWQDRIKSNIPKNIVRTDFRLDQNQWRIVYKRSQLTWKHNLETWLLEMHINLEAILTCFQFKPVFKLIKAFQSS